MAIFWMQCLSSQARRENFTASGIMLLKILSWQVLPGMVQHGVWRQAAKLR